MNEKILNTLRQLDPKNDAQWTNEGLPKIDAVRWLAKDQSITREDVSKAAPGFSRSATVLPEATNEQTGAVQQLPPDAVPAEPRTAESTLSPAAPDFVAAPQKDEQATILDLPDDSEELDAAKVALVEIDNEINKVTRALDEGKKYLKARQEERDQLVNRIEDLTPRRKTQNSITAYLNRQKELSQARAVADAVLKQKIGELGSMASPLPVDQKRR